MALLLWAWVKKTVHEVVTHWLSGEEKVLGAMVSKEGQADSLLKGRITIDFIEKSAPVKSASYGKLR